MLVGQWHPPVRILADGARKILGSPITGGVGKRDVDQACRGQPEVSVQRKQLAISKITIDSVALIVGQPLIFLVKDSGRYQCRQPS